MIDFYSDLTTENNLVLKILDETMSELRHFGLNDTNTDGSQVSLPICHLTQVKHIIYKYRL